MIEFETQKRSDEEIFRELNPLVREWFQKKFVAFSEPQKYAVLNIHRKQNTLVSAPTGSGKTFAAFISILSELISLSENNELEEKVYCIYVSPLRALNNDIQRNLKEPLEEIAKEAEKQGKKIGIRIAVRTGDTTTSEKAQMLRKPPHILITTPETIAILLNAPKFREKLFSANWLIIDELHALCPNKRGVHLSLSMERLQKKAAQIVRIGLSATVSPLEKIAEYLVGMENEKPRNCKIINVQFLKKLDLKVISPLPSLTETTQLEIHEKLYSLIHDLVQSHKTTLIFTNTRSATERVVHNLKESFPINYLEGNIGAHHSSLSREHRLRIEEKLKKGELKVVVSSTSLELGIDIGYIDLVLLIGSPKSVARALQRVGRSGHRLHDTIKGRIIILDRDDLVECSVLLKNAIEGNIDKIDIPENSLDVLSQQLMGIALEEKTNIDDAFKLIKQSYCYRNLPKSLFLEIIDYLAGKYSELEHRHVYAKIWLDEKEKTIGKRGKTGRIIYMTNIGTIPDEAKAKVKIGNELIGTIDEGFLERLKKGDVFVLGGQTYEFKYCSGMTCQVKAAYKKPPTVPSWASEMLPLSYDLSLEIQRFRGLMEEKFKAKKTKKEILEFINAYLYVDKNSANAIHEYFEEQFLYSEIPHNKKLIIEQIKEGEKTHYLFHSLFGRRANDSLSLGIGFLISKSIHKDIEITINDNGFMLSANETIPMEKTLNLLQAKEFPKILALAIQNTEMFNRRFRHCATRALMILRNYKGHCKSVGVQQMSSRLLLRAVQRLDPDFCIIKETRREIAEDAMDIKNALKVIEAIEKKELKTKILQSKYPSPFAVNLYTQGYSDVLKMEDKLEFLKRIHQKIMEEIKKK